MLESVAGASDTLLRIFAILAALCAVVYWFSSRQLQRGGKPANDRTTLEGESHRASTQAATSSVQQKMDQLQADNSRLSAELEKEQQLRIQTQRRFGPRLIGAEKRAALVETLSPFAGQKLNFAYFTDLETAQFAERILDAIKAAGWKPQVFKLKSMQPVYGIACGGPNPDDGALRALTQALETLDKRTVVRDSIVSVLGQTLQQPTDQLWVLVGLKRPNVPQHPASEDESKEKDGAVDRD
jgi:hypothetical protein